MAEGERNGAWLSGALAWFVPGAGHVWQGRWGRGLLLGGVVWAMFVLGVWGFGGRIFDPLNDGASNALERVYGLFDLGMGALYVLGWATGVGFVDRAELPTYEYGNAFLMVGGLLNYLVMLDAFDTGAGRKP